MAEQAAAQARQPLSLPTEITLADITLTLRYLEQTDGSRILTFARALSAHDMLFLRRDITREDQVEAWLEDAAHGLTTTVLALHGDEIVGYATVSSDGLSWTRHVRELRVSVAESMRQKRLNCGERLIDQVHQIDPSPLVCACEAISGSMHVRHRLPIQIALLLILRQASPTLPV